MRVKLYAHNPGSQGAKALAQALGIKRLKHQGSKFKPRMDDFIINWGSSKLPEGLGVATVINAPIPITIASNKLEFFRILSTSNELEETDIPLPNWTTDKEEALGWVREGDLVVVRTKLTGHSGEGIVLCGTEEELVDAPLYTKYFKKKDEYRIHVFDDKVIDVQRKAKRHDVEEPDWKVRTHANGFVFMREGVEPPEAVTDAAVQAVSAIGLTFGAVDVLWNDHHQKAVVIEVNTAPGLEGQTVESYAQAFRQYLGLDNL